MIYPGDFNLKFNAALEGKGRVLLTQKLSISKLIGMTEKLDAC